MVSFVLVVLSGLNVGLSALGIGVIGSLVSSLGVGQIFDILVGVSAAYLAATHMGDCKTCAK